MHLLTPSLGFLLTRTPRSIERLLEGALVSPPLQRRLAQHVFYPYPVVYSQFPFFVVWLIQRTLSRDLIYIYISTLAYISFLFFPCIYVPLCMPVYVQIYIDI